MAGLVEEGEEVISEGKEKDDVPADLALIGAAQRVEHYEIAASTTARNLALQLRHPVIVQLLTTSLGEEQNAGQLLDQVAQPLMSVAKMPASVPYGLSHSEHAKSRHPRSGRPEQGKALPVSAQLLCRPLRSSKESGPLKATMVVPVLITSCQVSL